MIAVIIAASKINQPDSGPFPRIMGIGPIRITAPPLAMPLPCVEEAIIIRIIPTNISAKLARKIQENPIGNALQNLDISV